jgi:hypothetical protein
MAAQQGWQQGCSLDPLQPGGRSGFAGQMKKAKQNRKDGKTYPLINYIFVPQLPQNLLPAAISPPQLEHFTFRGAPQSGQNFEFDSIACLHDGQVIILLTVVS